MSGFNDEFANQADLTLFLSEFGQNISNGSFTLVSVDGGQNEQDPAEAGVEANLDIQYTVGVALGVPVEFISVGDDNSDGLAGFLDEANFINNLADNLPTVLTTSYGFNEDEIPADLAKRVPTSRSRDIGLTILFLVIFAMHTWH